MRPLGDRVLIRPVARPSVTDSGLHLPEQSVWEPDQMGHVVALGSGRVCCAKHCIASVAHEVAVGDLVVLSPVSGQEVRLDDERLIVMQEADILAVIEPEEE